MYEDKRTIRVDSYDFFGYLAPGILVLISLATCGVQIKYNIGIIGALNLIVEETSTLSSSQSIFLGLLILVASYILGHMTGSISSLVFEKIIIGKVIQYPYKSLLFNIESNDDFSSNYYRSLISLSLLTVFFFLAEIKHPSIDFYFYGKPIHIPLCSQTGTLIPIIFILKLINDPISKIAKPFHKYYNDFLEFILFKFLAVPFIIFERIAYSFAGQLRHFPKETQEKVKHKYHSIFKQKLTEEASTEAFWSIYWYVTNNNQYIRSRMNKWLILYGFMRNLSCASIISSILLVVPFRFTGFYSPYIKWCGVILLLFGISFSFRYYYLYFGYYSKTVFRAFAYLPDSDN